jgi:hypothetical protein
MTGRRGPVTMGGQGKGAGSGPLGTDGGGVDGARGHGNLMGGAAASLMNTMAGPGGGGGAMEGPGPDRAPSYRPEWQGILRPKSLSMDWLWKVFG